MFPLFWGSRRFQNFLVIRDQIIRMSRPAMSFDAPFRLSKDRWGQHQTAPTLARDAWCLKWRDSAHHLSAKGSACPNSLIQASDGRCKLCSQKDVPDRTGMDIALRETGEKHACTNANK